MSLVVETPGPLLQSRLLVRQQARAAGFDVANDAKWYVTKRSEAWWTRRRLRVACACC